MIFVTASNEPTVIIMLSEQDVTIIRSGQTIFVDDRATGGATFNKVVLTLHASNDAALDALRQAGHTLPSTLATHEKKPGEGQCVRCYGLMPPHALYEGQCIVCWASQAKNRRAGVDHG